MSHIDLTIGMLIVCLLNALLMLKSKWTEDRLIKANENLCEQWTADRDKWHTERQQLMDRIQASSFAEYKTQEVRVIKAQNGEKEPPKLEQL